MKINEKIKLLRIDNVLTKSELAKKLLFPVRQPQIGKEEIPIVKDMKKPTHVYLACNNDFENLIDLAYRLLCEARKKLSLPKMVSILSE